MNDTTQSVWQEKVACLREGGEFSAAGLLTLMSQCSDEEFEEALALLSQKDILLSVEDLPVFEGSRYATKQLAAEAQLARNGFLLRDMNEKDPLYFFLKEISALPVQPQLGWVEKLDSLNKKQQEKIAEAYLPRIAAQAKKLAGKGVLVMDLVQEGSLGVWQGLALWNGQPLEDYLDRCMLMAMHRAIAEQAWQDGIGGKLRSTLAAYNETDMRLLNALGRNPTVEEIAREMEIPSDAAEALEKMLRDAQNAEKNSPVEEEKSEEGLDVDATAYYQMRQRIADLLGVLPEEERRLLTLRFGLETGKPMDVDKAARLLGISREEAVRREENALAKLRKEEEQQ